ncbi:MAG: SGNH/GDSL hydrolase family protein [Microbacteriaceae bacterium]|nr:SGNH/GDSL hydrolase family protein [Microbacteriaceae bacterium]
MAASVAPATASPVAKPKGSAGGSYVAIGDSFTAGQGAATIVELSERCKRSQFASYPAITAGSSSYREALNFACSGADTDATIAQLADIGARTKLKASLVTITVGGIDANSDQVLAACALNLGPLSCEDTVAAAAANLMRDDAGSVFQELVGTYTTVAAAFPKARIVVLNYPRLFDPNFPTPQSQLASIMNDATDGLNGVIALAVEATKNPRVSLTDVTDEFAGHGIGSNVPYISFNREDLRDPINFHPNALGNTAGYSAALRTDGAVRGR